MPRISLLGTSNPGSYIENCLKAARGSLLGAPTPANGLLHLGVPDQYARIRTIANAACHGRLGTEHASLLHGALHSPVRDIKLARSSYPSLRRRSGSCSRYLVRAAGGRHKGCLLTDDKLLSGSRQTCPTSLRPPRSSPGRRLKTSSSARIDDPACTATCTATGLVHAGTHWTE